jgi:hypothetical protein
VDNGATAEAMRDCLADAGLNAVMVGRQDKRYEVEIRDAYDADDVVWIDFDSGIIAMPAERPIWLPQAQLDTLLNLDAPSPALLVSGADYTEAYVECRSRTGYKIPERESDPRQEATNKLGMAQATNDWIACARKNGLPGMADVPPPKVDGWLTLPMALLPTDIAESELRALLDKCPAFDLEKQLEWDKAAETDTAIEPLFFPNIGFDADGFNGDSSRPAAGDGIDRLRRLLALVDEAQLAYWDSLD